MLEQNFPNGFEGRRIALPESRQLDVLAGLLERRGAVVLSYPLVAIRDSPDQVHVAEWLRRFIEDSNLKDLIILTGEGIHRLLAASERIGLRNEFVYRLGQVRKIARGPKPGRVLREIGLASDVVAKIPTTTGVIVELDSMEFSSQFVAVQLYGNESNQPLQTYLHGRGLEPVLVSPYIYAEASTENRVLDLIDNLAQGKMDAIIFTSQPQIRRLFSVARIHACENELRNGLAGCMVAAVGPVVAECLLNTGIRVDAIPDERFFMRPLVDALMERMSTRSA